MRINDIISISLWQLISLCLSFSVDDLLLHEEHIPYFMRSYPACRKICASDKACRRKYLAGGAANSDACCWGYEPHCPSHRAYHTSSCDRAQDVRDFFLQADFGYIQQRLDSMFSLCLTNSSAQSLSGVHCSRRLEFCRATNVMLDFRQLLRRDDVLRYKMDVLGPGQMVANCSVDHTRLLSELEYMSPLQSWAPEVQHLTSGDLRCDLTIDTPTYIMKIDAAVNMYHHFCDFFNLYASQHLNDSVARMLHEFSAFSTAGSFDRNKQILIWENVAYRSAFAPVFDVFTSRRLLNLHDVAGKRVCFTDLVLPLPPRMIFGLFYNTPLVDGCRDSGLFRAFNRHLLQRLYLTPRATQAHDTLHVLWLSRRTPHRRVVNERQIIAALQQVPSISVQLAEFTHSVPFAQQAAAAASADILVGVHGAGLTHQLLLPDWAVVYELHDCGDPLCYGSLARLRGLKHIAGHSARPVNDGSQTEGAATVAHEKFTNYSLDVNEVLRQIQAAVRHVRAHPAFIAARKQHAAISASEQSTGHQEL